MSRHKIERKKKPTQTSTLKSRETFPSIGNAKKWVIKLSFDHNGYDIGITFDSLLTHTLFDWRNT